MSSLPDFRHLQKGLCASRNKATIRRFFGAGKRTIPIRINFAEVIKQPRFGLQRDRGVTRASDPELLPKKARNNLINITPLQYPGQFILIYLLFFVGHGFLWSGSTFVSFHLWLRVKVKVKVKVKVVRVVRV